MSRRPGLGSFVSIVVIVVELWRTIQNGETVKSRNPLAFDGRCIMLYRTLRGSEHPDLLNVRREVMFVLNLPMVHMEFQQDNGAAQLGLVVLWLYELTGEIVRWNGDHDMGVLELVELLLGCISSNWPVLNLKLDCILHFILPFPVPIGVLGLNGNRIGFRVLALQL